NATLSAQQADLRLTKTVDNSTPNLGENVTFTIEVTNDGPNTATNLEVRDQLPAGLAFVSAVASQGSYDSGSGIWNVGDLAANGSQTLQITASVTSTAGITNVAQVSAVDQEDPDSTPNNDVAAEDDQDDAILTTPQADLQLTKTVDNSTPNLLDNVTFTISLTNNGPQTATNVEVRDQLPAGLAFVSALASQGSYDSGSGIWSVGDLAANGSQTLQITASVTSTSGITNVAQVSAADQQDPDSTPDNDMADEDDQDNATLSAQQADLRLTKTVDNSTPNLGENVTFTVAVTNDGPNTATNLEVRDLLPAGLSFVSDIPSQGSYDDGSGVWSVGTLDNNAGATLQITATVDTTSAVTNVAQVRAVDQEDPDSTPNNSVADEDDQDNATLSAQEADLSLSKSVDNGNPNFGETVTFTVTLTNNGPNTATNVQVSDTLPAELTFVSANASQGNYNNASGVWTVGDLIDDQTATLQITATVQTVGAVTNTAQVTASDQLDPDSTPNNNQAGEDDQDDAALAAQVADLSVTKSVDDASPDLTEDTVYTVTVTNAGPNTATEVEIEDILPAGVSLVSSNASQGSYNGASGIWTVGTLAEGATASLEITTDVTTPGTKTNIAQVHNAAQLDPDSTPANSASDEDDQDSASLTPVALSSIAGHVFFDADNDGIFDPRETPIQGVTIELTGPINRTVITGPDGAYLFDNLVAGDYFVEQ
ncbi:MAG: DUF11 domain-containing protein, partial [Planctomycetales bacterium]|nr:DUF11 domain-containing protein [Planctomycetales bacterium]NIM07731.1 DUF11 domain-containing protein [Planctomycetales bacterium]NIN07230.1 DUF11 domain-containing protein [Planctomycetales bacterium]NIN76323.1 DUF11 domain-containing protein [Planctomycetales bacterium]NIO33530.1 DUF11 domain-containing protein [Planctomycetales bacterium]